MYVGGGVSVRVADHAVDAQTQGVQPKAVRIGMVIIHRPFLKGHQISVIQRIGLLAAGDNHIALV